ncbi:substrate-binding periplasmic protein [Marinobacter confluentis]|uniref:Transporter substrate-binding domain-containing protein n=1 Tax=Marinobacter confluentis TaxID=1697557 RepID=A0A4Z1C7G8_9GAMM|nr:transporter substrate-binding domain-containing protein [Marinobacter confluentis]TGN38688.1 transporter substrate-binding domain-containing protein [Marinobacter confluentis]
MLFRNILLAPLLTLTLGAVAVSVHAEQPVIEVVTSEYPPYEYLRDGEVVGDDTRIIRRVLAEMGYQANIRILPWARAEQLARNGRADMLYSLTFSETRDRHYYFTAPINAAQDVFYKRRNHDLQWQTLDDLAGLNFGLSAAYSYAPEFMDWLFDGNARMTKITHEKPELTGLRLVGLGRIDLFICELSVCDYLLEQNVSQHQELANVERMAGDVGPERSFRAAFSRKLPNGRELRDEFNAALKKIRASASN